MTGRKDEGHVQGPLHEYLKSFGVPQPVQAELAAKIDALVKDEIAGRKAAPAAPPSFAAALEAMRPKQRHAALDAHYAARTPWVPARNPHDARTPDDMRAWLDKNFPDRREIGFALSDLRHLDARAYAYWTRPKAGVSKAEMESLGVPSKSMKYDPVRDADAPKSWNEICRRRDRGEGSFKDLHRSYNRARYHAREPS